MEHVQREIITLLLRRVYEGGLISESTYSRAADLVHSSMDLPAFLRAPTHANQEGDRT